jgi:EmrB/QacA subfamily drug resistance transporter
VIVLGVTQFVLQVDAVIVTVALRPIQQELGFAPTTLQWVVTGYALTFGSLLLLGGRLGDLLGRRRVLLAGLVLFGVASVACGLAWSPVALIGARLLQGAGAAIVAPAILAMLTAIYPEGPARARAMGIWTAASAAGGTTGILAGGVLTEYLGWRSVFLVNVPVLAVLVPLAWRRLPDLPGDRDRVLDPAGAVLVTAAIAALILGLTTGHNRGYGTAEAIVALAAAAGCAVAFVAVERRVRAPMVPWRFLAVPVRRVSLLVMLVVGAVFAAYGYFVALYLPGVLGFSPVETGLALLPIPLTLVLVSTQLTRRLIARFGLRTTLTTGLVLLAAGQLWLSRITAESGYPAAVLPGLILTAAGGGLLFPAMPLGLTRRITPAEQGLAGGLLPTAQQVGAAVGLAVLATVAAATTARAGPLVAGYQMAFLVAAAVAGVTAAATAVTRVD